jgi:glucokinase
VEAEASTCALPGVCRSWPGFETSALREAAALDYQTLFALADAGDRVALEVRDRCRRVWAAGAVSLVHAYDPEVVVIGGGVMRSAAAVLPFIEEHVHRHAWTPWGRVEVRAAALGDRAGLLGAVPLLAGGGGGSC